MSRDADGNALNGAHRQKYLLSGLLACGVCGGGFTIVNAHDYGCSSHRAKGTCGNHHRIRREDLERRVLDGLKHRLLAPELVEQFARDFQEEVNRQAAELSRGRAQDEGRMEAVRRKIGSMIRAIEAVRQLRGEAHPELQVPDCEFALVHGSGFSLGSRASAATAILCRGDVK